MQEIDNYLFRKSLAQNIKKYRKLRGFSQEALAEKSSISVDFLAKLEIGYYSPNSLRLVQISNALQTTPNDLLSDFISEYSDETDDFLIEEIKVLSKEDRAVILTLVKYVLIKNK